MLDESAAMLAAELARREVKHVQMRELLDWLAFHRFCGRQRGLCAALDVPPAYLSQYKSGKGTHGQMSPAHLDTRYKRFFAAIARAGLPTVIPTAANDDGLCPGGTPLASAGGGPPQTAATVAPQPALLTVNMAELKNQGGDASITSLGAAVVADQRWLMARPGGGAPLHLRDGLRGRRAFALRRSSAMGGRIFEWWIQRLEARHDPAHHGAPLWVARELTDSPAIVEQVIIGQRKIPSSGLHGGPSSAALLALAIAEYCGVGVRIHATGFTGLLHPAVQEFLDHAASAAGLTEAEAPVRLNALREVGLSYLVY